MTTISAHAGVAAGRACQCCCRNTQQVCVFASISLDDQFLKSVLFSDVAFLSETELTGHRLPIHDQISADLKSRQRKVIGWRLVIRVISFSRLIERTETTLPWTEGEGGMQVAEADGCWGARAWATSISAPGHALWCERLNNFKCSASHVRVRYYCFLCQSLLLSLRQRIPAGWKGVVSLMLKWVF